ncbi:MAG: filamentous hemagglutinin N-terminal domain-containing protein [Burkholderiales bacterium]
MLGQALLAPGWAVAQTVLPRGAVVVAGQARVDAVGGSGLTVTQSSARAVVQWDSFSIGRAGSVNFVQPDASSAILNRVTGDTPTVIAGRLSSNGLVYLVNPNGIAITSTGTVQVGGGFVASTLDLSADDFMAGRLNFTGHGSSAPVRNAGSIEIGEGGYAALLGGTVGNSGTVRVALGKVGLGSGERITIDPAGDGFLQVTVPTRAIAADTQALLDVSGQIHAPGGTVELNAATLQQAVRDAVHVSGAIAARSVSGRDGKIVLDGGSGGNVTISGELSTAGGSDAVGGTIIATGAKARLDPTARLDASGASGGNILVGGDLRGGLDPAEQFVPTPVRNAQSTTVSDGAIVNADGLRGAGGNVVVWSDAVTSMRGAITALGSGAGAGGSVEVSSHGVLDFTGRVDVRAASGKTGTLLLDPYDITISSSADATVSNGGNTFSPTANSSVLSVTTLQNALANANVTVTTGGTGSPGGQSGDLTVSNAVSWGSGNSLTLNANQNLNVNANLTATNGGAVTLSSLASGGSVNITGATIATNGGNLNVSATATGATTAIALNNATLSVGSGTGMLTSTAVGGFAVSISGATQLSASTGSIGVNGTASATTVPFGAGIGLAANAELTTVGSVTLTGVGGTAGSGSNLGHGISLQSGATLASTGSLTLLGTAAANATNRYGLYFNSGNTVAASSGSVDLRGTASGTGLGVHLAGGSLTLVNNGAGSFGITGTGASNTGLNVSTSTAISTTGAVALTGNSTSGTGLQIGGTVSITNNSVDTLALAGNSGSNLGVLLSSTTFNLAGNATLTGTSQSATGMYWIGASAVTVASGNVSFSGSSVLASGSRGVWFNTTGSTLTNQGAGTLQVNGSTGSSNTGNYGLGFGGSVGLTTSGTVSLTGSATNGAYGVKLFGDNSLSNSSGNFTLSGTSNSNHGVLFNNGANTLTNNGAGSLGVIGTSASGSGLRVESNTNLSSGGTVTLAGVSTSNVGLNFGGTNTLTASSGNLSFSGSSVSNSGLFISGSVGLVNSGAGTLSFSGTGDSYRGIELATNAAVTVAGNTSFTGVANTGTGIFFNVGSLQLNSGNLSASGSSTTTTGSSGSVGLRLDGSTLTNAGSGTMSLVGGSANTGTTLGDGVRLTGNVTLANGGAGSLSVTGNNNAGNGLELASAAALATSGGIGLSGTSASALGLALQGTGITHTGTGTLTLNAVGGADLAAAVTASSGPLVISGSGNIAQSAGSIVTGNLLLSGANGNFTLNAAANQIGTLAASAGSVAVNASISLNVGIVLGTAGVATSGTLTLRTDANLTIGVAASVSGASPVLSAAGAFVNNAGSGAVAATSGRWLVYSSAPGADTFGNLDSSNSAVWNASYSSLAPGGVVPSGNRYLFATQPTLTFTSTSPAAKIYGADLSASIGSQYAVTGYQSGVANAFLSDTAATAFNGAPAVASAGAAATADVSGSPYTITVGAGTLASAARYGFSFQSNGQLTVNPAPITVTALGGTSTYGSSPTNPGLSATGLQNGQSVSVLTGLTNSFGIAPTSNAGSYTLNVAGTLSNANYSITATNTGTWAVSAAPITVTALGGTSIYGASPTNPGLSATGLQNGQSVSVLTGLTNSFGIVPTSDAGGYTLNVAGTLSNANYEVTGLTPGTWTVRPAAPAVAATKWPARASGVAAARWVACDPGRPGEAEAPPTPSIAFAQRWHAEAHLRDCGPAEHASIK